MQKRSKELVFLIATVFYTYGLSLAQPPRGPLVRSPQVNPDKTVTFRYNATAAKNVMLSAQFEKGPVTMNKDASGIWTVTTGPLKPDIYPYNYICLLYTSPSPRD